MKQIFIVILILITQLGFSQTNPLPMIQYKYRKSWDNICKGNLLYYKYAVKSNDGGGYVENYFSTKDTSLKGKIFTFLIGVDSDKEENIKNYQEIAYILMNKGATVYQFYGDQYKPILDYIKISDVIVYEGHGGFDPKKDWIGFMFFRGYRGDNIMFNNYNLSNFKFKEGSTFIFSGSCYAAGESASDTVKISETESIYRSSARAKFLLDRGLSTYLAINKYCGVGYYLINRYIYHYNDRESIPKDLKKDLVKDIVKDDLVGIWSFKLVLWKRKIK